MFPILLALLRAEFLRPAHRGVLLRALGVTFVPVSFALPVSAPPERFHLIAKPALEIVPVSPKKARLVLESSSLSLFRAQENRAHKGDYTL